MHFLHRLLFRDNKKTFPGYVSGMGEREEEGAREMFRQEYALREGKTKKLKAPATNLRSPFYGGAVKRCWRNLGCRSN